MKVNVKKVSESAILPTKAHSTDAGYDLYADSITYDEFGNVVYGTGVAMEIPEGYVGLIFPRSSLSEKDLVLSNAVGVVDSGYRGEVKAKFKPTHIAANPLKTWWQVFIRRMNSVNLPVYSIHRNEYLLGERIAQMIIIPYPEVELELVDSLSVGERGDNGFGSTGK